MLLHRSIKRLQACKIPITQGGIYVGIHNTDCFFHHRFIRGAIRPGGTKKGLIIFAELVALICKHRLIAAEALYRSF